jgi:hypothetical protein
LKIDLPFLYFYSHVVGKSFKKLAQSQLKTLLKTTAGGQFKIHEVG